MMHHWERKHESITITMMGTMPIQNTPNKAGVGSICTARYFYGGLARNGLAFGESLHCAHTARYF